LPPRFVPIQSSGTFSPTAGARKNILNRPSPPACASSWSSSTSCSAAKYPGKHTCARRLHCNLLSPTGAVPEDGWCSRYSA